MTTTSPTQIKPVLFVLTSHGAKGSTGEPTGYFLAEVTHPLAVLEEAGIAVEFASIQGGEPPVDGLDLEDTTNARYWNDERFRHAVGHTQRLQDVDSADYSAIFFAGGHGTMWDFPTDPDIQRVTRDIYERNSPVGAVCHGPSALVNVTLSDGSYLVAGKSVCAFTNSEEQAVQLDGVVPFMLASELTARGAEHQPAPNWSSNVIVDGQLVTGQNPQSASAVGEALRDLLLASTSTNPRPKALRENNHSSD
jgi:putative intracellular protease/amidase